MKKILLFRLIKQSIKMAKQIKTSKFEQLTGMSVADLKDFLKMMGILFIALSIVSLLS